ncbi:MAG TPA: MaoC family dehydratase [Candidatus Competibacteraceae bacterium]|nr:MaoC family dehydratase [Candidatus Competibacteraceae bacterium]
MDYRLTTFDDLAVGQRASFAKTITEADIAHFVACTGDVNPLHVNEEFARRTFFGQRIAHGLLSASLLSTVVGMSLPGVGAIYRSQTLEFLRAVHIGDTLTASLEITRIDRAAELIEMDAWIDNQRGERVIRGKATASLLRGLKE